MTIIDDDNDNNDDNGLGLCKKSTQQGNSAHKLTNEFKLRNNEQIKASFKDDSTNFFFLCSLACCVSLFKNCVSFYYFYSFFIINVHVRNFSFHFPRN